LNLWNKVADGASKTFGDETIGETPNEAILLGGLDHLSQLWNSEINL
jgi:hypothetical protein